MKYQEYKGRKYKVFTKTCKFCGKEFETIFTRKEFCDRIHTDICRVCGKEFEIPYERIREKDRSHTCSRKCAKILQQTTYKNRTGYKTPAENPEIQKKIQETNLKQFGTPIASQSDAIKEKTKSIMLNKYGVEAYTQTSSWKYKTQQSSLKKYGSMWPTQSEQVKCKTKETNLNKYGYEFPMQSDQIKFKFIESHMSDPTKLEIFKQYRKNPALTIENLGLTHKPTIYELSTILGVNESTVGWYLYKHDCRDLVEYKISKLEQEVTNFILSLDPSIQIEHNVHNIITPNELDLYLPQYNLAFECNPTSTHNSTINVFSRESTALPPDYHLKKTDKCTNIGIFLFHIFGYEWTYKSEIIKSMIANKLGKINTKIYARKCSIKEVPYSESVVFLNTNHRQGNVPSKVRLGLYYENELVSLMTFGKRSLAKKEPTWELLRFCTKLNTIVVGGASKLFKYFIKNYESNYILSYSDKARTSGNLYNQLGFMHDHDSDPSYVWVNLNSDLYVNRFASQKQNLDKLFPNEVIDKQKTEKEIMIEHGYVQVFDSGTIIWKWLK